MSTLHRSRVIRLVEAQARIPGPAGEHAIVVFQRGPLDIALSLPQRPSQQTPHALDEIYFIVRGRGVLLHDGTQTEVGPTGDGSIGCSHPATRQNPVRCYARAP
jgi:hypothetical protein